MVFKEVKCKIENMFFKFYTFTWLLLFLLLLLQMLDYFYKCIFSANTVRNVRIQLKISNACKNLIFMHYEHLSSLTVYDIVLHVLLAFVQFIKFDNYCNAVAL